MDSVRLGLEREPSTREAERVLKAAAVEAGLRAST